MTYRFTRDDDRQRKAYGKAWETALRKLVPGTGWRKKGDAILRQDGPWFVCAEFQLLWPTRRAQYVLKAKPMALDSLIWKLMDMEGNEALPLSSRCSGAFVCESPVLIEEIVQCTSPEQLAMDFLNFANAGKAAVLTELKGRPFSELLSGIDDSSGMLSTTKVISLLNEHRNEDVVSFLSGDYKRGIELRTIRTDEDGHSRSVSFFDLAYKYALSRDGEARMIH